MFSELTNATFFGFYWRPQQGVGPVLQVIEFKRKTEPIVSLPDTVLGGRSLMYPFVEATLAPSECIGTIINSADG